ncbi:MAG: response regulator transcription factor [Oscillospiraceae bacterium]|nr:response regulator transcription factor [Oscillospiraceae bacterium]
MSKILIIEDDIAIAEIERDYLEINGFEVKIETDGVNGMNTALKGGFQLVLLDLMLPEIDGFTVCRSLREHLDIPILMVTAKKEDIDKIRGLGLGADDYIVKPFSPGELVARVQAHIATYNRLKGGIQEIQPEITVGAIRINPKSHRVFVKEKEISLKNKEYELLLFLVTNADMVFDKETLYERIWGMDSVGDNATVAVHINRLREKIEDDPSDPHYIETVWGAGYRFRA